MTTDAGTRGRWYLHRLTATDRSLLAAVAGRLGLPGPDDPTGAAHLEELLSTVEAAEAVLPAPRDGVTGGDVPGGGVPGGDVPGGDLSGGEVPGSLLVGISSLLVFAVAIHRAHRELDPASVVAEWTGPRERVPVFAGAELRTFLDDGDHRLFLADLLASFTHVGSGVVTVRRGGTVHRQRFSELDPAAMARLVDVVDEASRPALYRRLGDASLYLTGVFPDHTARTRFAPIQVDRLARSLHRGDGGTEELAEALALHGAVGLLELLGRQWYRLAVETASGPTSRTPGVTSVGDHFSHARRVLNHLTDRWLYPFHATWLPTTN